MKWIIAAACLTCGDPTPAPIAEISGSMDECKFVATKALEDALPDMPPGLVGVTWCVPVDDWQEVDDYPQRR